MTRISHSVEVNQEQVEGVLSLFEFIGGNSKTAIRVAINSSLPKGKSKVKKRIAKDIKITETNIAKKIDIRDKATSSKLTGRIKADKRGLLLSRFSTDAKIRGDRFSFIETPPEPPRGIKVEVRPKNRKTVTGHPEGTGTPFFILLKNHNVAIAQRRKVGGLKGGKIKVLHGPSISQVYEVVKDQVDFETIYEGEMLRAINYLLKKQHPIGGAF